VAQQVSYTWASDRLQAKTKAMLLKTASSIERSPGGWQSPGGWCWGSQLVIRRGEF